jgi:hypothetical protein
MKKVCTHYSSFSDMLRIWIIWFYSLACTSYQSDSDSLICSSNRSVGDVSDLITNLCDAKINSD